MGLLIFFSLLSAFLYRLGGTKHGTKCRNWGVPTCMLYYFIFQGIEHWSLVLCWLLMFGAQTTYFKKDGTDAKWFNWLFVGLAFSCSMFPYYVTIGDINSFFIRSAIVTIFTVIWSQIIGKAWLEESGRGFIQIITIF